LIESILNNSEKFEFNSLAQKRLNERNSMLTEIRKEVSTQPQQTTKKKAKKGKAKSEDGKRSAFNKE
jgi:uncharacterized membrane protein YukC